MIGLNHRKVVTLSTKFRLPLKVAKLPAYMYHAIYTI